MKTPTNNMTQARDDFWAAFEALQTAKSSGDPEAVSHASAEVERLRAPFRQQVAAWLSGPVTQEQA